MEATFSRLMDKVYSLPLEEKKELVHLLGRIIAEERRSEIYKHFLLAKADEKEEKLSFSSDIEELKKML